jgi:hypothetical protein
MLHTEKAPVSTTTTGIETNAISEEWTETLPWLSMDMINWVSPSQSDFRIAVSDSVPTLGRLAGYSGWAGVACVRKGLKV